MPGACLSVFPRKISFISKFVQCTSSHNAFSMTKICIYLYSYFIYEANSIIDQLQIDKPLIDYYKDKSACACFPFKLHA